MSLHLFQNVMQDFQLYAGAFGLRVVGTRYTRTPGLVGAEHGKLLLPRAKTRTPQAADL